MEVRGLQEALKVEIQCHQDGELKRPLHDRRISALSDKQNQTLCKGLNELQNGQKLAVRSCPVGSTKPLTLIKPPSQSIAISPKAPVSMVTAHINGQKAASSDPLQTSPINLQTGGRVASTGVHAFSSRRAAELPPSQMLGTLTAVPIKVPQVSPLHRLAGQAATMLPQVRPKIPDSLPQGPAHQLQPVSLQRAVAVVSPRSQGPSTAGGPRSQGPSTAVSPRSQGPSAAVSPRSQGPSAGSGPPTAVSPTAVSPCSQGPCTAGGPPTAVSPSTVSSRNQGPSTAGGPPTAVSPRSQGPSAGSGPPTAVSPTAVGPRSQGPSTAVSPRSQGPSTAGGPTAVSPCSQGPSTAVSPRSQGPSAGSGPPTAVSPTAVGPRSQGPSTAGGPPTTVSPTAVSPCSQGPTLPTANSTFSPDQQPNRQSDAPLPYGPSGGPDSEGPIQQALAGPGVAYAIIASSPASSSGSPAISEAVKVIIIQPQAPGSPEGSPVAPADTPSHEAPPAPTSPSHKKDEDPKKVAFMVALGLVTTEHLEEIQTKRQERKRRSTANPAYSGLFEPERKRLASHYLNSSLFLSARDSEDFSWKEDVEHEDLCAVCKEDGELQSCHNCPRAFHPDCLHPPLKTPPRGPWYCPRCQKKVLNKENMSWPHNFVQSYVTHKTVRQEEKRRLLRRSSELKKEFSHLEEEDEKLSDTLKQCMDLRERLLGQQRDTQASLERLKALIRLIQRDQLIQVTMTTTATIAAASLLSQSWIKPTSAAPPGPSATPLQQKSHAHSQEDVK